MMSRVWCLLVVVGIGLPLSAEDKKPVFSGPQVGEKLPKLSVLPAFGKEGAKAVDVVGKADGKPFVAVFFHKKERPAFGLMRAITRFVGDLNKDKTVVNAATVFLTNDRTEMKQWLTRIKRNLPAGTEYTISQDGVEGPGAWGLNRNVSLTVVVAKKGKATANFALVQPSAAADGPKILKAIHQVSVGGKTPNLAKYLGRPMRGDARPAGRVNPELGGMLRSLIQKTNSKEEVAAAKRKIEAYLKKNPKQQAVVGRISKTIATSDRLGNYGTPAAQEVLKEWAKTYGKDIKLPMRKPRNQPNKK